VPEGPGAGATLLGAALPGTPKLAPHITKSHSEPPVSSPSWGPAPSTSTLAAPSDAPSAPHTSYTRASGVGSSSAEVSRGATTDRGQPRGTMARSPMLTANDATMGTYRNVTECAACRQMIETKEVRLLSPKHQLFKPGQEQEKREWCKPMDNTMRISGRHQQERPRAGPLGWGLRTPGAQRGWPNHHGHNNSGNQQGRRDLQSPK
jgi:hypothetical protein